MGQLTISSFQDQGRVVGSLEDEFARYLLAYETEENTGEPEFDQITNVRALARFLVALANAASAPT